MQAIYIKVSILKTFIANESAKLHKMLNLMLWLVYG